MTEVTALDVVRWIVCAFFAVGAIINLVAPASIRGDYERWGYPRGFQYVTAGLEFCVVLLLLFPSTSGYAALLGALVMLAATGTTLFFREFKRAIPPAVMLIVSAILAFAILTRP